MPATRVAGIFLATGTDADEGRGHRARPRARPRYESIGRLADDLIVHPEVGENHVARTVAHRPAHVDPFVEDDFDDNVAAWGGATPGVLSERLRELDLPPAGDGVLSLVTERAAKEAGSDKIRSVKREDVEPGRPVVAVPVHLSLFLRGRNFRRRS